MNVLVLLTHFRGFCYFRISCFHDLDRAWHNFPLFAGFTLDLTENSVRLEVGIFTPPPVCNLICNRYKLLCFDSLEHQAET